MDRSCKTHHFLFASIITITVILSCNNITRPAESAEISTESRTSAAVPIDTTLNTLYVIEVQNTDKQNRNVALLGFGPIVDSSLNSQVVLRARDSVQIVQITTWKNEAAARQYAAKKMADNKSKVRMSRVVSHGAKQQKLFLLDNSSSVQYSEFLMKRKSALETLSSIAKAMTVAMAKTQPTLDFITTLNSTDSTTISLLGIWNTQDGFEIFSKSKTFGDKPYWTPYADNDHHMFDVMIANTSNK